MINRPKPPPHILKRLQLEEQEKRAKREKKLKSISDPKRMTANAFGHKLQTEHTEEGIRTEYPFKPILRKIPEKNEDEPYGRKSKNDKSYLSEERSKRGKSLNSKFIQSNGFTKSAFNNSTSYQTNFNDAAISTTTSKNFITSPHQKEEKRSYQRSDSIIARSACYSTVPCPY